MTESLINLDEAKEKYLDGLGDIMKLATKTKDKRIALLEQELEAGRERIADLEARAKFYQEHNFVDATPDGGYAMRILQSYRAMCNCSWSDVIGGEPTNPLCIEMNAVNEKRKIELDEAIAKLAVIEGGKQ